MFKVGVPSFPWWATLCGTTQTHLEGGFAPDARSAVSRHPSEGSSSKDHLGFREPPAQMCPHPVTNRCRGTKAWPFQTSLGETRRVIPVQALPAGLAILLLFLPSTGAYHRALLNKSLTGSVLPQNLCPHQIQPATSHPKSHTSLFLVVSSMQKVLYLLIKLLFTYFSSRV